MQFNPTVQIARQGGLNDGTLVNPIVIEHHMDNLGSTPKGGGR
jgi:hypothetical protein